MPASIDIQLKTAVLVVHGMGIHRPLEMLRGIVKAVWGESDTGKRDIPGRKRLWFHPEWSSAIDVDLPVMTASAVPKENLPKIDFHELYWSHLMSETRAIAVLLWLFELARKGPRLQPGLRPLWWGTAIFLTFLILSVIFLGIQGLEWVAGLNEGLDDTERQRQILLIAPTGVAAIITFLATLSFLRHGAFKVAIAAFMLTLLSSLILVGLHRISPEWLSFITTDALPIIVAGFAIWMLMGSWGLIAFALAFGLSIAFYYVILALGNFHPFYIASTPTFPWSLNSQWGTVLAWINVAIYLAFTALFLQPYFGDAARYFRVAPATVAVRREIRREAVNTLEHLHKLGKYDRIIVVAHSLGSVIAYDMLRSYFARVAHELPTEQGKIIDQFFDELDSKDDEIDCPVRFRDNARELVRRILQVSCNAPRPVDTGTPPPIWLVTDFVTLGSPLTHALYLMCEGDNDKSLREDFKRRVAERELPTCPPTNANGYRRLTFVKPSTTDEPKRIFHHGALFGLTRWTNLYFPASNLFWGDAIGGPIGGPLLFGNCVKDVEISTNNSKKSGFFCHIAYWDTNRTGGCDAPHIEALRKAINLEDKLESKTQS